MSDNIGPKELSNAFKYLLAYQLDSIASDGVMPSAHGALHKLLCSCYSKNTEVVDIYGEDNEQENQEQYTKRAITSSPSENNNMKKAILPAPSSPSQFPTSSELSTTIQKVDELKKRKDEMRKKEKEEKQQSPIIVEVYDDTPHSKVCILLFFWKKI
ncbi:hypothetical protein CRE_20761 [Caenorhabditis remanei]|uniref:Uncharacterized protein n=1 Tax=Caenorhabditis remanei TaxID=31234 RepID=E3MFF4_CAERE|nr:hypothetical protein CRE_20761 [Caenorhabditis remanei]